MFKIQEIVKTANEALAEILKDKDLYVTEINYNINGAATFITEDGNETGSYKWNRMLQMEQDATNGTGCYKWNRKLQMEQDATNGTGCYKWNRMLQMEQDATNGTGCYKSETYSPNTPSWVRRIQENIDGIRKGL